MGTPTSGELGTKLGAGGQAIAAAGKGATGATRAVAPQAPPIESAAVAGGAEKANKAMPAKTASQAAESSKPAPPEVDMERTAAVFKQLRLQLTPSTRHATINLVPADLGRIVIHLTVKGGRVSGEIRADKDETLKILEAHAPELRAALEQNGFDSTDLNLARHGDPSPERPSNLNFPLSETTGRESSSVPESAPEQVLSILREDKIDTLA